MPVLRGAGLRGIGPLDVEGRPHRPQDVADHVGNLGGQDPHAWIRLPFLQHLALAIDDLENHGRIVVDAARGQHPIGVEVLLRHHLAGADRLGQPPLGRQIRAGEPHHARGLEDAVVAQLLQQEDGGDVARLNQRPPDRDHALVAMVPVDEGMAIDLALLVEDQVRGRVAIGERRGVDVDLEGGAGLAALAVGDDVVLTADGLVVVVRAADHRQHLAGCRVNDFRRAIVDIARPEISPVDVAADRPFGHLLQVVVERRVHPQAAARHDRITILFAQLPEHVVDKPGSLEVLLDAAVLELEHFLEGLVVFRLADVVVAQHVFEHQFLAVFGAGGGGRVIWIELRRRVRNAGQHGSLRDIEVLGRLGEVGLRGGLGAVGLVAVEDLVQIQRQDVVLRKAALDLEREGGLAHLPLDRGIATDEHPLDQLLGDGAGPLLNPLVGDIGDGRRDDAADVNAVVGVEEPVLQGNGGVDQMWGDGREWHHGADDALRVLDVQQDAIAVVNFGRLRQFLGAQ